MDMKKARKLFAGRSYFTRQTTDAKTGGPVDVKVRKREPKGNSFRTWARENRSLLQGATGKLAKILNKAA
jgi:hypothetical protein